MVQLDELDEDVAPAELQLHASPTAEVPGLWLASRDACVDGKALVEAGVKAIAVFGPNADWLDRDSFGGRVHVYPRAENGALITNLKETCDFLTITLDDYGAVACTSEERGSDDDGGSASGDGEAGAGFVCAAYMIIAKGKSAQEAADAVEESRPGCGLKAHDEFMKNLRFLQRNGIPDWA